MGKKQEFKARKLPGFYKAWVSDPEKTGIRLFALQDKKTGVVVYFSEFNENFDVHATIPWAGARTSRSPDSYEDIFTEITTAANEGRYSAGKKLSNVFINYGHASVADMSPVMLFINNIPMHQAFWLFNHTSTGGGQELSTRYVEFKDLGIPPIKNKLDTTDKQILNKAQAMWVDLQNFAVDRYHHWVEVLTDPIEDYLKENMGKDATLSPSTITARVLDVSRMWIPMGTKTSMTILSSARNYIDLCGQLRSVNLPRYKALGDQIVNLLELKSFEGFDSMQAELGDLTKSKYYEGSEVITKNIEEVKKYIIKHFNIKPHKTPMFSQSKVSMVKNASHGDDLLLGYIAIALPALSDKQIASFIKNMSKKHKSVLGEIIFKNHTHHELMRNAGDVRGITFSVETAISYQRDINRHRAMGRLIPFFESTDFDAILDKGFNMNYQIENAIYWRHLKKQWQADAKKYYEKLFALRDYLKKSIKGFDSRVLMDVVPMGHQITMYLSGPSTQWSYFTSLRVGLGGDYGYRSVAWQILENLRESEPVFESVASHLKSPDVNDVEQIMGRS